MVNQDKEKHNYVDYEEKCVVRFPKNYNYIFIVGIVFLSSCLFMSYFFPNGTESLFTYYVFVFFLLLDIFIIFITNTWQIEFHPSQDFFVLTDYCRKKHVIHYSDCVYYKYRYKNSEILVHNRIKTFTIIPMMENSELFLCMLILYNVAKAD